MHIFYTPDIASDNYVLSKEESIHCVRVLRLSANDTVALIDGRGGFYKACIENPDSKACLLRVVEKSYEFSKHNYKLSIAVGIIKQTDRLEWFIEKATEIGIDEIVPLVCKRSEKRHINIDRWERVVVAAMKQSIKAYKPVIKPVISFDQYLASSFLKQKYIAYCFGDDRKLLTNEYKVGEDATILIGPEGDFSPEELQIAIDAGFIPVSLGDFRLRTETAALIACTAIALLNNTINRGNK